MAQKSKKLSLHRIKTRHYGLIFRQF